MLSLFLVQVLQQSSGMLLFCFFEFNELDSPLSIFDSKFSSFPLFLMNSKKVLEDTSSINFKQYFLLYYVSCVFHKPLQLFWGFSEMKPVHISHLFAIFFCFQTSFLHVIFPIHSRLDLIFKHPVPKSFAWQ